MLIHILSFLDVESLCKVMLVNSKFYNLAISNRKIWRNFCFKITRGRYFTDLILKPERKFENVSVHGCDLHERNLRSFVHSFADHIQNISIFVPTIEPKVLGEALRSMTELQEINVCLFRVFNFKLDDRLLPNFYKLEKLTLNCSEDLLGIFKNASSLKSLSCSTSMPSASLLCYYASLKELELQFIYEADLFNEDFSKNIRFSLVKFSFSYADTNSSSSNIIKISNFTKFICSQKELREVVLTGKVHRAVSLYLKFVKF